VQRRKEYAIRQFNAASSSKRFQHLDDICQEMKTVSLTKASKDFFAVLDYVMVNRVPVQITKRGKPMVRLEPIIPRKNDDIFGFFHGQGKITGDIISPISPAYKRSNKKRNLGTCPCRCAKLKGCSKFSSRRFHKLDWPKIRLTSLLSMRLL
jgi:prevent-host-death family protein